SATYRAATVTERLAMAISRRKIVRAVFRPCYHPIQWPRLLRTAALVLAAPIGLMGGIASASYYDLAMRSCPPGLQGTLMMMVDGVYVLSARGGDLLGSDIYSSSPTHGFLY